MANLMQLEFNYESIMELIKSAQGEITSEVNIKLLEAEQAVTQKIDAVGFRAATLEAEIEACRMFENAARLRRQSIEADLKGFKVWLANPVRQFGTTHNEKYTSQVLEGKIVKIKDITREVTEVNMELLPAEYKRVTVSLDMPYSEYLKIMEKKSVVRKFLEKYYCSDTVTVDKTKVETDQALGIKIQGVGTAIKPNVQFLGLKKLGNIE